MKKWMFLLLALALGQMAHAQTQQFQLSSHILDISKGSPAAGVKIALMKQEANGNWKAIDEKFTDANGRIKDFLPQKGSQHRGIYKLVFFTKPYFEKQNIKSFFPFVEVVFELNDDEHYHIPITLSPYGYSTYRGS